MTGTDELYAAILASPNDMDLRLRFADAVEAADPGHAELIRLQVAEHGHLRGVDRITDRTTRINELRAKIGARLAQPVAGLVDRVQVRCGFPDLIQLTGGDFLTRGERIFRLVPVRHLLLTAVDPDTLGRIMASPLLDQVVGLDLGRNRFGDAGLRVVLASPHLRRVRWLGLSHCGITGAGAEELAAVANEVLPDLRYLRLAGDGVDVMPYVTGYDGLAGFEPHEVFVPPLGQRLDATYGPFAWLKPDLGWDPVDFDEV